MSRPKATIILAIAVAVLAVGSCGGTPETSTSPSAVTEAPTSATATPTPSDAGTPQADVSPTAADDAAAALPSDFCDLQSDANLIAAATAAVGQAPSSCSHPDADASGMRPWGGTLGSMKGYVSVREASPEAIAQAQTSPTLVRRQVDPDVMVVQSEPHPKGDGTNYSTNPWVLLSVKGTHVRVEVEPDRASSGDENDAAKVDGAINVANALRVALGG